MRWLAREGIVLQARGWLWEDCIAIQSLVLQPTGLAKRNCVAIHLGVLRPRTGQLGTLGRRWARAERVGGRVWACGRGA